MNPNHYLAVAIEYLFSHRPGWPEDGGDRQDARLVVDDRPRGDERSGGGSPRCPSGSSGSWTGCSRATTASAAKRAPGASFLRKDGTVWTTDKDGILLDLLAAEITAVTGNDPGEHYAALEERFGSPVYAAHRRARHARAEGRPQKALARRRRRRHARGRAGPRQADARRPATARPIGGLKVVTENGWFAARPSGTEDIYKIYAESFRGADHLAKLQAEAKEIVSAAFERAGVA